MNTLKLWKCTRCKQSDRLIAYGWNNRFQPGRDVLCARCDLFRKKEAHDAKPKPPPKPRKEITKVSENQKAKINRKEALNRRIWANREHVCFETGQPLGDPPRGIYFSHVHSKGARPDWEFREDNIVLHSPQSHDTWEFDADRATKMPKTQALFDTLNVF